MPEEVFFNGINGSTGLPLDNFQLTTDLLAKIARQKPLSASDLRDAKIRKNLDEATEFDFGVAEGIDIANIAQSGWGVIFPASLPEDQVTALKEALHPLLELRKEQASRNNPSFYQEFIGSERGYQKGESKGDFLRRFGVGSSAANPENGVPFYLLIVGSPEEIPFSFQYLLDLMYGVGRIWFDTLESYVRYAESVIAAEKGQITRAKSATFFGVRLSDRDATRFSSDDLVNPLAEKVTAKHADWAVNLVKPKYATKATLSELLGGPKTPALLFTASHGMGFNSGDPRQLPHTGALLCQDYTEHTGGEIPDKFYFSADDIPSDANVSGTFAFFFACYGAGSSRTDNFYHDTFQDDKFNKERIIAPYDFISRLPLKLLSHPKGGALGVFAHVDRAWAFSFLWNEQVATEGKITGKLINQSANDSETFRSMISALLNGKPAGAATDYFGMRYADIGTSLSEELSVTNDDNQDEMKLAWWWTFKNDARNYTFIGDPAVRLAVAK
jgi:hypothetical protein